MTLGEIIKKYRTEHDLSQRSFALLSGLSNSYISQLEQNANSKNGQPIIPSIIAIQQVANAMNVPVNEVLDQLDDIEINITKKPADVADSGLDEKIMIMVRKLPSHLKLSLYDLLQAAIEGLRPR